MHSTIGHRGLVSLICAVFYFAAYPLVAQNGSPSLPDPGDVNAAWRNKSLSPDERAKDLLGRLTLQEKVLLLHADGTFTTPGLPRFGGFECFKNRDGQDRAAD